MSRLKSKTVTVRDESFTIREWTPAERTACLKRREEAPNMFSTAVAQKCTLNGEGPLWPKEEAAAAEPAELIDSLAAAILELSGVKLESDEKNA